MSSQTITVPCQVTWKYKAEAVCTNQGLPAASAAVHC